MFKTSIIAASLALASLGAAVSTQASAATVYVQVAPPPPRTEVMPGPRRGMVWVPGNWEWRGRRYVWMNGHYVRGRPGYRYAEPVWEQRGERWVKRPGIWERGPNGDRDHDGVPNGRDNHPNNPARP